MDTSDIPERASNGVGGVGNIMSDGGGGKKTAGVRRQRGRSHDREQPVAAAHSPVDSLAPISWWLDRWPIRLANS